MRKQNKVLRSRGGLLRQINSALAGVCDGESNDP